ncbi:alpha/beta fold hydrolase [Pseudonocardia sp. GCM10023141]|uniref:alpha/beta fold hydrolase n=1 Tax=Pseudonocardia sp. GCM10023141 TaxID=3252653 RepID=UPI00361D4DC6
MDEQPVDGHSKIIHLDEPVHYVDFGGRPDGPVMVLVHGLGGSHLNWNLLAPELTPHGRVFAVDLPGFGLSESGGHRTTVPADVEVLARFIRTVCAGPVVLVGNSMGGMVSMLLAARSPALVRGLVLLDPALPAPTSILRSPATTALLLAHAVPGVGERLLRSRRERLGARGTVAATLDLCGIDPATLPASLLERFVALAEHRAGVSGVDRAFLSTSRSLAWVLARRRRYRSAMAAIGVPVLLVHGDRDPLVPVTAARATIRHRPAWRYIEMHGVGHMPQLQVPGELAMHIRHWLRTLPATGVHPAPQTRPNGPAGGHRHPAPSLHGS